MPTVKINNANYNYEIIGKGQPIVFISGYTMNYQVWTPLLERLINQFQFILFDNRAAGLTMDDGGALSSELMAQDVVALIDQLQLVTPHIVGHSMGSTIAQCVATLAPEKINRLVLMNSTAKWREAMIYAFKSFLTMRQKNIELDLLLDGMIAWNFGNAFLVNKNNLMRYKAIVLQNPHPQSLQDQERQYKVLQQFDGRKKLADIRSKTLVISGVEDLISLPYEAEFLVKHISNATGVSLNCGHAPVFEVPDELSKVLIDFL